MRNLILGLLIILSTLEINAMESDKDDQFRNTSLIEMPNTTWRDDKTGDWLLGIYPEGVVYDCQFWNYVEGAQKKDNELKITNGKKQILINVGVKKNGKRKFVIDGKKYSCSVFTGNLPDYPKKDKEQDFVDNGYRVDTATIVGWMRYSPWSNYKAHVNYTTFCAGFVTNTYEVDCFSRIDSLGRFIIKVPLLNSSSVQVYAGYYPFTLPLEPGKTYYMMNDFSNHQTIFMGDGSRVLNELINNPIAPNELYDILKKIKGKQVDIDKLPSMLEPAWDSVLGKIADVSRAKPKISSRYLKFMRVAIHGLVTSIVYESRNTSHYSSNIYKPSIRDFIVGRLLPDLEKPYTLWDKNGKSLPTIMRYLSPGKTTLENLTLVNADKELRSLLMATEGFFWQMSHQDTLRESKLKMYQTEISIPCLLEKLETKNNYLENLIEKTKTYHPLADTINYEGITDGEEILRKIIAPYKGRYVIVDFWGSWCGACRVDMKQWKQKKVKYFKYDPVYIFLAFDTPDKLWKQFILDLELTDKNMYHYNLSKEQGRSVRNAYKAGMFPNYLIFDKEGTCKSNNNDFNSIDFYFNNLK